MSESAERTPVPPGPVAPAASADQPGNAHVQGTRLQRRPTGTPPPLPHPISVTTTAWVLLAVVIVAFAFVFSEITPWRRSGDQANTWLLLRLAEARMPFALQRWSLRRVGLALAILAATVIAVYASATAFRPPGNAGALAPTCGTGHSIILAAQAVPSAALVPCAAALPAGWQVHDGADIASGHATFWLDSDVAGGQAFAITLSATCDVSGAQQVRSDQPGTRRFDRPLSQQPQFAELRFYTFAGGCVSYQFNFSGGGSPLRASQASGAVRFMPRAALVNHVKTTEGLALCGRGAACPG